VKATLGRVCLLAILLFPGLAGAFDCTKASSQVELMICANPDLIEAETQVIATFAQVKANAPADKTADLDWAQQHWRVTYRDRCEDVQCLRSRYSARLQDLNDHLLEWPTPETTPAANRADEILARARQQNEDAQAVIDAQKKVWAQSLRAPMPSPTPAEGRTVRSEEHDTSAPDATPVVPKDAPAVKSDTPAPPGFFSRLGTSVGNFFVAIGHGLWWLLKLVFFIAFLVAAGFAYKRVFTFLGASLEDTSVTPGRRKKLWVALCYTAWFAFVLLLIWRLCATVSDAFDWLDSPQSMLVTPWLLATRLYVELWALSGTINLARIYANGRRWNNRKRLLWGSVALCFMLGFPAMEFIISSTAMLADYLPTFSELSRTSTQDLSMLPWWLGPTFVALIVLLVPLFLYLIGLGQLGTLGATATFIYGLLVFFPVLFAKQLIEYDQAMARSLYQQGYFTQGLRRFHNWVNNIEIKPPPEPKGATYQNRQGSRFATAEEIAAFLTPEPPDAPQPAPAIAGYRS
jgi:uncharacterized protein